MIVITLFQDKLKIDSKFIAKPPKKMLLCEVYCEIQKEVSILGKNSSLSFRIIIFVPLTKTL